MSNWDEIDLKGKSSGQIKTKCPSCINTRTDKSDKSLSVNIDSGVAKCHYCDEVFIKNPKGRQKEYKKPPQTWSEYTGLSEKVLNYLSERGISAKTAMDCRITDEKAYFPKSEKERRCISFNYFEGSTLVNKKFRTLDKEFSQFRDAKKIFYGINDVIGLNEFYIVEGEFDKLAFWEAGYKNVISVPNGANDLNDIFDTCGSYIKDAKTVFIAVDMDEKGRLLEENLVRRFGKHRCKRIEFKGKDANEDLITGNLQESIRNPVEYPIEGLYSVSDIWEEFIDLYENGLPKPLKPKGEDWKEFNEVFSVVMGQLTVVTGIPSHGKSNWMEWYLINLINDFNLMASFYSPEHGRIQDHFAILAEKAIGKPFEKNQHSDRMTKTELFEFRKWSDSHINLTHPKNGDLPTWDWVLERFEEQVFQKGINVFVVDAWNKVKMKDRSNLGEISDVLSRLTSFAQQHNVLFFLVAHPKKMQKDSDTGKYLPPTLYDVAGSADFYNITHNGLTVHRNFEENFTEVIPTKVKLKHQSGKVGSSISFQWNEKNSRYFVTRRNDFPIFEQEKQELPFIDPFDDSSDDLPF